eukprot:scaffold19210_cov109-Skeletonema_marinoi.AAC.1
MNLLTNKSCKLAGSLLLPSQILYTAESQVTRHGQTAYKFPAAFLSSPWHSFSPSLLPTGLTRNAETDQLTSSQRDVEAETDLGSSSSADAKAETNRRTSSQKDKATHSKSQNLTQIRRKRKRHVHPTAQDQSVSSLNSNSSSSSAVLAHALYDSSSSSTDSGRRPE